MGSNQPQQSSPQNLDQLKTVSAFCESKRQAEITSIAETSQFALPISLFERSYENVNFILCEGIPTIFEADAVFNATDNPYIVERSNYVLSALSFETTEALRQKKPLNSGESSLTNSGLPLLPYVLHACLPVWEQGRDGGINELYFSIRAYHSAFKLANEKLKAKRLVFCDLTHSSTQIPRNLNAEAFVKGVIRFLNESGEKHLKQVMIVNKSRISTNAMRNQMMAQFSIDIDEELQKRVLRKESIFLHDTEKSISTMAQNQTAQTEESNQNPIQQNSLHISQQQQQQTEYKTTFSTPAPKIE